MDKPDNVEEVLIWLLDPTEKHRETGRTKALLTAYSALAVTHPGVPIKMRDHYANATQATMRNFTDVVVKVLIDMRYGKVTRLDYDTIVFEDPNLNFKQEP